jgi:hypothetical protein
MALTELSLPVDLPWKRMGVSKDMIDVERGDLDFPYPWRSSIALFYHEPAEVPPEYCNRRITYLKVVCTITNYQVTGEEVTVLQELDKKYGEFYAWQDFDARITNSFPCHGALLQLSVFPNPGTNVPLHDYPYITAFQPRKREMYEVMNQSGEVASQSASKMNVLKGTTNTQSTENYDFDEMPGGGGSAAFGLASWQSGEQQGTISRSLAESQNVTNQDASREKRESHSYSTSINQLYTLLQGFHVGTNRAAFLLAPTPHTQDQKFSFIRGLRRIEGVQEFILIVDRPSSVKGLCVEVALETAHAYLERAYWPRIIPFSDLFAPGNLDKTAAALGIDATAEFPHEAHLVEYWNGSFPVYRYLAGAKEKSWPPPQGVGGAIDGLGWVELMSVASQVPGIGTEEVALIFEEYEADSGYFFVTGRKLCSCVTPQHPQGDSADDSGHSTLVSDGDAECEESSDDHISTCDDPVRSIVWTTPLNRHRGLARRSISDATRALELNEIMRSMTEALSSSLASTTRVRYGATSLLETEFVLDELAELVRLFGRAGNVDPHVADIEKLRLLADRGLGRTRGTTTALQASALTTRQVGEDLGLSASEAARTRSGILLETLRALDMRKVDRAVLARNPKSERFRARYPEARLRSLVENARLRRQSDSANPQSE